MTIPNLPVIEERLAHLMSQHRKNLAAAHARSPRDYSWPIERLDEVLAKCAAAIRKDGICMVSIRSPSWRRTCKDLGIKHTYTAIAIYLSGSIDPSWLNQDNHFHPESPEGRAVDWMTAPGVENS